MAVIKEAPGLDVTVVVNGQDLTEYEDLDEEKQMCIAHNYVEATSGAYFSIAYQFDPTFWPEGDECIRMRLYLDGKRMRQWNLGPFNLRFAPPRGVIDAVTTHHGDRLIVQNFAFAELVVKEGDADENLWGKLGELGTIVVECWRVRVEEVQAASHYAPPGSVAVDPRSRFQGRFNHPLAQGMRNSLIDGDEIPEKNLKGRAITHQARLSNMRIKQLRRPRTERATQPATIHLDEVPFATFNFKYRSRRALQSLQVIPRTPTPSPEPEPLLEWPAAGPMTAEFGGVLEEDKENMNEARGDEKPYLKRGYYDDPMDGGDVEFVSETRRRKRAKFTANPFAEIVDLCGDD